jgi:methylenetetrahydrofolate reductase (NADPH)
VDYGPERQWRSSSHLEGLLRQGQFVVTCEVIPPASTDAAGFLAAAERLRGTVDAVQVADNAGANLQMSGLIAAHLLERLGLEVVLHMTCRDRNRNQLQADLLGAHAAGVKAIRCLTGEYLTAGDHPEVKPVFDLDQIHLIYAINHLREKGAFLSGRELHSPPQVFIGATVAPLAPPRDYRLHDLGLKVAAGADFVVLQAAFDPAGLSEYLHRVSDLGLDKKVYLMAEVGLLTDLEAARTLPQRYPGTVVPAASLRRLEGVPPGERRREGLKMAVETIQELRGLPALSGINLVPTLSGATLEAVLVVCEEAGLVPRPAQALAAPMAVSAGDLAR